MDMQNAFSITVSGTRVIVRRNGVTVMMDFAKASAELPDGKVIGNGVGIVTRAI